MGGKGDSLLPYIQFLVRSIHHSRFTLHARFEVFNPVAGMEVCTEMRVDFHFFQNIGCLLRLRTIQAKETAQVPLKGTAKIDQVI